MYRIFAFVLVICQSPQSLPFILGYVISYSSERTVYAPPSYQRLNERERGACDPGVPLISIRKAVFFRCGMLRMNRGLRCHTKFSVDAPQRVLDLPECLYSINNKSIFIYSCATGKCKCFPWAGKGGTSVRLLQQALFIGFVESIQGATAIYMNRHIFEGMLCIDWLHLTWTFCAFCYRIF